MKQDVGFPVYALQWQNDTTIIASGGGGIGKSGVRNKIVQPPHKPRFDIRSLPK
jgi:hypothetical protein